MKPEQLLAEIKDNATFAYEPDKFTTLNDTWRGLIGWHNSYYRWLWSAVWVLEPRYIVEIGRERGVSTLILRDAMRKDAMLDSLDIVECVGEECFVHTLEDKRVTLLTGDSTDWQTASLLHDNIDFLFIDGDHTYESVAKEWALYIPKLSPKAIVVMDDIHFNNGMTQFWNEIEYEKYDLSEWHDLGFGVVFIGDW